MPTARHDALIASISARLRRVCAHMTDDEFAMVVRSIAATKLKYEDAGPEPVPPPGAGDRPADGRRPRVP